MRRGKWWRAAAVATGIAVALAACGDDDAASPTTTAGGGTGRPGQRGALEGMKGTAPGVQLTDEFKQKLDSQGVDTKGDYTYGAESYDAAIVIALAAMIAGTDGIDMAKEINGVTRGGTKCTSFRQCSDLVKGGTRDIDYDGVSGPMEFSGNGEPTVASYSVQVYGADNRIDASKTTFKQARAPREADVPQVSVEGSRPGNGTLKIGTLLPVTGSLSFLGPPEIAGVRAAVKEINEAGGVLGRPVELTEGDSSDAQNPAIATQTVDRLLGEGVDAIIGAASSAVTLNVIDKVVNAGVVMFSPANTSKRLSTYPDKGLYFRNAPSDILQGQVLAEVVAGDGTTSVGLLVLNDAYGTGLADDFTKSFEASGGRVVEKVIYDPKAQTFDSEVDRIRGANPAGVVIIGFEESSRILTSLVEKGIGPKSKRTYLVDGNLGNNLGIAYDAGN